MLNIKKDQMTIVSAHQKNYSFYEEESYRKDRTVDQDLIKTSFWPGPVLPDVQGSLLGPGLVHGHPRQ